MASMPRESGASGEMVQVVDEPRQVTDAIAVRVGEAAWVHLVDNAVVPPSAGRVLAGRGSWESGHFNAAAAIATAPHTPGSVSIGRISMTSGGTNSRAVFDTDRRSSKADRSG